MTIELVAISREDGWAIIKALGRFQLVSPPYKGMRAIDEDDLGRFVADLGFEPVEDYDFKAFPKLLTFLRDEMAKASEGTTFEDVQRRALEDAPPDMLERFLDRVERELIPEGHFEHALSVLTELLQLDALAEGGLVKRATDLLKCVHDDRRERDKRRRAITDDPGASRRKLYFNAYESYGDSVDELSRTIRERRQVLATR